MGLREASEKKKAASLFLEAKCPTQVSEEKGHGVAFFRSDTPRIGKNEASAMPSAHFAHIRGEVRFAKQSVIATMNDHKTGQVTIPRSGWGIVSPPW